MCTMFHTSGKYQISNKLLKSLDIEKEIGVEIILKYFPGIPQCDKWDFFKFRIIFANSKGLVFNEFNGGMCSKRSRCGAGSLWFWTVDLDAKKLLKILLFSCGTLITESFSTKGGVLQNLLFLINLRRMLNYFFSGMEGLLKTEFIMWL